MGSDTGSIRSVKGSDTRPIWSVWDPIQIPCGVLNFGVPFREFRGDSAPRVLISACLSAYPGCQESAFPRIQGARNQRLQGARNQRCGVYFGLAPRVGVERVQLFVGVGASSWCNFFRLRSPRGPLRRAFFFLAVFSGARRWWVLLLVVVLVGWL